MTTLLVRTVALFFGLSSGLALGCDKKEDGGADADDAPKSEAETKADDAPALASVRTFEKTQRKKGCEMLTPKLAAEGLGVPEGELEQMKMMGCIYSWKSADKSEIADASLMNISIRKDAKLARAYFEGSTKDRTAEEVRAELAKVMEATKKREEIDTKSKKTAVSAVGGIAGAMVPDAGYQYSDVPGVGDAARASSEDGAITVLLGNMVFNVRAYKGKPSPELDMTKFSPTDTKAMVAAAKEIDEKWKAETLDARKAQAAKVAKAIVDSL